MFNFILYISLNLIPLYQNYYVKKMSIQTFNTFKINCQLKKQINETKNMKSYLVDKIVTIYKQFIPEIIDSCKKSKNPKKCVIDMTNLEYNRYITWINNFDDNSKNIIYENMFSIIRNRYSNKVKLKKEIENLLKNKKIVIIINKNSDLSSKIFNKIVNKKINITNKNFINILKILLTDKSISNFSLKCNNISAGNLKFKLSNKIDFYNNQDINEIKMIVKDNKKLTCDNITNICYNISDTIDIVNNVKQKYLSWYNENFTGAIKYIMENKKMLIWTGVKINKIKLNTERLNLTYWLLDKLVNLSGNKLIISNKTWVIEKLHKIYNLKYWKDLFILINAIKINKLNYHHKKKKKVIPKRMLKPSKKKTTDILKIKQKLIKESKDKIKKQLKETSQNSDGIYILWWAIFLIISLWWFFLYHKKKYKF